MERAGIERSCTRGTSDARRQEKRREANADDVVPRALDALCQVMRAGIGFERARDLIRLGRTASRGVDLLEVREDVATVLVEDTVAE